MGRAVHFRVLGVGGSTPNTTTSQPTACYQPGFNTLDTDLVTCGACQLTGIYILTHQRHHEVVEALAYPKEDHPCLSQHQPSPTSADSPAR
jgi:hypothetical protein